MPKEATLRGANRSRAGAAPDGLRPSCEVARIDAAPEDRTDPGDGSL